MVNLPIDISLLIGIVGCALGLLAFFGSRRQIAVLEGKHLQQVEQLDKRVTGAEASVTTLKESHAGTAADTREIKTDLVWIKKTLTEIKERLPS